MPVPQVAAIRYTDGKCIGTSLFKGDAGLYCVDLTKLRPFARAAAAPRAGSSQAGGWRCAVCVPDVAEPLAGQDPPMACWLESAET